MSILGFNALQRKSAHVLKEMLSDPGTYLAIAPARILSPHQSLLAFLEKDLSIRDSSLQLVRDLDAIERDKGMAKRREAARARIQRAIAAAVETDVVTVDGVLQGIPERRIVGEEDEIDVLVEGIEALESDSELESTENQNLEGVAAAQVAGALADDDQQTCERSKQWADVLS
ncbi:hypothetical protein HK102_005442, partial [Quaeritorhiza haematococci]